MQAWLGAEESPSSPLTVIPREPCVNQELLSVMPGSGQRIYVGMQHVITAVNQVSVHVNNGAITIRVNNAF